MRTVAVYFTQPGFDDYPFDKPDYREGYHQLARLLKERGAQLWIVRGETTYRGGNAFEGRWEFRDNAFHREEGMVAADLIFLKGRLTVDADARCVNDAEFDGICTDKWATYRLFPDLCPKTVRVQSAEECRLALDALGDGVAVVKPVDGEEGKEVMIAPVRELKAALPKTYPRLVQALIDTSGGIPGVAPGKHDLRLIVVQGRLVSAFVRMPAEGKFVANVAQGGSIAEVPVANIPAAAIAVIDRIDTGFARFPKRIYSADLGLDRDGSWKIIELNAQPGLSADDWKESEGGKRFFIAVADLLASA